VPVEINPRFKPSQTPSSKMPKKEVAKGNRYDLPGVIRGLTAIAYANGNCSKASRDLKEAGIKIRQQTLSNWLRDHKEDYERIRREILPQVGAVVADEHLDLARKQIQISNELAARLQEEGRDIPIRDVAGAMRNADVGASIHTERARDLQGDFETPNKQNRSLPELIRALKAKGVEVIDGQATEETIKSFPCSTEETREVE
jgi:hypothetical protein